MDERTFQAKFDELLDKIIREMGDIPADLPFEICPHRVNEPFLDKRIFEYIPRINDELPNAQLSIATNGSTLTDATLDRIAGFRNVHYFNGFWAWDSWKQAVGILAFDPDLAKDQMRAMFGWLASGNDSPAYIIWMN